MLLWSNIMHNPASMRLCEDEVVCHGFGVRGAVVVQVQIEDRHPADAAVASSREPGFGALADS